MATFTQKEMLEGAIKRATARHGEDAFSVTQLKQQLASLERGAHIKKHGYPDQELQRAIAGSRTLPKKKQS